MLFSSQVARDQASIGGEYGPNDVFMYVAASEILYFLWDVFEPITQLDAMNDLVASTLSNQWEFDEAQVLELPNGRQALTAISVSPDNGQVAAYIIVEYDEARFLLFLAIGGEGKSESLMSLLTDTASSLLIGDEVSLETASVTEIKTVELGESALPLTMIDNRIYAIERCRQCNRNLLMLSLTGEELARFDSETLPFIIELEAAQNGGFWVSHHEADIFTYDVSLLSPEGNILLSLGLKETFVPPSLEVDSDGNLYVLITYEIEPEVTQPPHEVRRNETETWLQVWNTDGILLREFLVNYEEYDLASGPNMMALDPTNNIYVLESDTNRGIVVFDEEGNILRESFAQGKVMFQSVTGFDVMPDGTIFLGISLNSEENEQTNLILHLNTNGELEGVFTAASLGLQDLYTPTQFTMNENGDVTVVGISYEGVQVFQLTLAPKADI